MQYVEEMMNGSGGVKIYTQRSEIESPKGAVMILHGYCEHSQRYGHVVDRLIEEGFNCYLLDHRGHGKSEGPRAAVGRFEEYLADMDIFLEKVRTHYPEGPLFILGHSMGGLITANYMLDRNAELDGVVLSSPYLGLKVDVPAWKSVMGKVVSRVLPAVSLKSEIDPYLLTHDEAIVQEYISDPSVSKIANARWFTESNAAQAFCMERASAWRWPALIMHGGDDRIADPDTTRLFAEKAQAPGKSRLVILEGLYHEIFNEVDRKRVLDMTAQWLNEQVG